MNANKWGVWSHPVCHGSTLPTNVYRHLEAKQLYCNIYGIDWLYNSIIYKAIPLFSIHEYISVCAIVKGTEMQRKEDSANAADAYEYAVTMRVKCHNGSVSTWLINSHNCIHNSTC